MSKRFSSRDRKEVNRKQRKARWIMARNQMRMYPDCNYDNLFYCNHVYDPKYPWTWVDFRFFHTRLKRYFAVAMVTAEYEAYNNADQVAYEAANFPDFCSKFVKSDVLGQPATDTDVELIEKYQIEYEAASERQSEIMKVELAKPVMIAPHLEVKDYGPVAVGIFATVNNSHIDEQVIRDFISFYRELGEPITPGFKWIGEEVQVVPERLSIKHAE